MKGVRWDGAFGAYWIGRSKHCFLEEVRFSPTFCEHGSNRFTKEVTTRRILPGLGHTSHPLRYEHALLAPKLGYSTLFRFSVVPPLQWIRIYRTIEASPCTSLLSFWMFLGVSLYILCDVSVNDDLSGNSRDENTSEYLREIEETFGVLSKRICERVDKPNV